MTTPSGEDIWSTVRGEAERDVTVEPMLAGFLYETVLRHDSLEDALATILASKLDGPLMPAQAVHDLVFTAFSDDARIGAAVRADLTAVVTRDPACRGYTQPLLYFKGFHAVQAYRVAHHYWAEHEPLALYLQSRISEVFAVDIHPAARIGKGIMLDHATSVTIGATAVVDDDVSMLHEVTLGGTGHVAGDRHPKIRRGVLIGAGAKVLGNVVVGECARVAAGSVVLKDVDPHTTVAGIPAKVVGVRHAGSEPALEMDQTFDDPDERIARLDFSI